MQSWFGWYLRCARILGYKIVWTAHDLLPHEQVFENDGRARDTLIARANVVIALSEATAAELRALGARHVEVIPMGSYAEPYPVALTRSAARASFGFEDHDLVVSLIGRLEPYKGADLLLLAAAQLPASSRVKVLLAGQCLDPQYKSELRSLTEKVGGKVVTHFQWIPDEELARYLQATDFAVFPFREISNSGSIMLAQSFGRPVIIPNLPILRDIPDDTALRFEESLASLISALERSERLSESAYREMSASALAWASRADWITIAAETMKAYGATGSGRG